MSTLVRASSTESAKGKRASRCRPRCPVSSGITGTAPRWVMPTTKSTGSLLPFSLKAWPLNGSLAFLLVLLHQLRLRIRTTPTVSK